MSLGFEKGITDFYDRRINQFQNINLEGTFEERVKGIKDKIKSDSAHKPTVVILGAGPAGIIRGIQSIANGNPTRIIEKRSENANGRTNTVALTEASIQMMKYCGIYQYLAEKKLILPPNRAGFICVNLTDLENAMKAVLKKLNEGTTISYNSKVSEIVQQGDKINLIIESTDGQKSIIQGVDILVNAEGSHSSTNSLLNIKRVEVLPKLHVISALFKDRRPKIRGLCSLFSYTGKSMAYLAVTIHYHALFILRSLISKRFRAQFTGSLILKTPGQSYLGCSFSEGVNKRLLSLRDLVNEKKDALSKATTKEKQLQCKKELQRAKKKYQSYAGKSIKYSLCAANSLALLARMKAPKELYLYTSRCFPLSKFSLFEIGADRANEFIKSMNKTSILLAGDALATVDPATGLGCNTAIQSSTAFLDFLWDYDAKGAESQQTLLKEYSGRMNNIVDYIHTASKTTRSYYRR